MGDGDPRGGRELCACPEMAWGGLGKSQSREPDRRGRAAWGAPPQVWKFVKPPSQLCPRTALPAARDTQTTHRRTGPPKWLSDPSGKPQPRYGEGGRDLPTPLSVVQGNTPPSSQKAPPGTPLQVLALFTGPSKSFHASVPLHGCSLLETQFPLLCLVSLSSPWSQLKASLLKALLGPPDAHPTPPLLGFLCVIIRYCVAWL